MVSKAVESAASEISGRIASLEDIVLTLAEALLRPAVPRGSHSANGTHNGRG
jgi:hypothetical protein